MWGRGGCVDLSAYGNEDWWTEDADDDVASSQEVVPAGSAANNLKLKRALERWPPPSQPLKRHASEDSTGATSDEVQAVPRRTWSGCSWSDDHLRAPRWQGIVGQQDRDDIKQWVGCTCVGSNVPGTPIVPCKTPFEGPLADRAYEAGLITDGDWFGKEDLVKRCADQGTPIGLVVDLVNTYKYYWGFSEETDGIEYQKVPIPGRSVPERALLEEVFDTIDSFVARRPEEYVAVHCTHGVNRTGFLVCAYLMTRAHLPQRQKAVAEFEKARGSKMDKQYLLEALLDLQEGKY
mmetsp:Transcript_28860/g.67228  ORF Transcript_28860/g.67228 Transcript_28860/m.67228 type:complete len:292 (+) Transcript_28860:106-981(+)